MFNRKPSQTGRAGVRLIVAVILLAAAGLIFWQRQAIADQISVWSYQPSAEISRLAERSGMSDDGKFHFYASRPSLLGADEFNQICVNHQTEGATLGCYHQRMIFIYDISEPRLDGIKEVTAAHEMLHAVYDRMDTAEKEKVHVLIDQTYEQLKNQRLAERLELYEKTQPGTRYIELHAILGSEYRDLASGLENHYSEFFKNRSAVVALHESYIAQFTARETRANEIRERLDTLSSTVEAESGRYSQDTRVLSRQIEDFNTRAADVDSYEEQNSLVAERSNLMRSSVNLQSRRSEIEAMIIEYNRLVTEYNNIATEVNELNQSLDSDLDPAPSV